MLLVNKYSNLDSKIAFMLIKKAKNLKSTLIKFSSFKQEAILHLLDSVLHECCIK